jgi:excisionase family DNA binding protein
MYTARGIHMEPEQQLYTVDDACHRLGIRRSKFYQLAKAGKLEIRKIGTRSVVPSSSIARFIESLPVMGRAA